MEKEERRAKVADCSLMLQPKFNPQNGILGMPWKKIVTPLKRSLNITY
jgi:hypothetical protein